jgi:hypothetical protein
MRRDLISDALRAGLRLRGQKWPRIPRGRYFVAIRGAMLRHVLALTAVPYVSSVYYPPDRGLYAVEHSQSCDAQCAQCTVGMSHETSERRVRSRLEVRPTVRDGEGEARSEKENRQRTASRDSDTSQPFRVRSFAALHYTCTIQRRQPVRATLVRGETYTCVHTETLRRESRSGVWREETEDNRHSRPAQADDGWVGSASVRRPNRPVRRPGCAIGPSSSAACAPSWPSLRSGPCPWPPRPPPPPWLSSPLSAAPRLF